MTITSSAFLNGETIPPEHTCEGDNTNPPLTFSEIPENARSLVLIVEDPDAPEGLFTHWTIYNMTPSTLQVPENGQPNSGVQGLTSFGSIGYGGPCPPAGTGTHRYFFRLFALDTELDLEEGAAREVLDNAMEGRVTETAALLGHYEKR